MRLTELSINISLDLKGLTDENLEKIMAGVNTDTMKVEKGSSLHHHITHRLETVDLQIGSINKKTDTVLKPTDTPGHLEKAPGNQFIKIKVII